MKNSSKIITGLIAVFAIVGYVFGCKGVTNFKTKTKTIVIKDNETDRKTIEKLLAKDSISNGGTVFNTVASATGLWSKVKPGRYEIKNGASAYEIIKALKNGLQKPVKLTIIKVRTTGELAKLIGKNFSIDSASFHKNFLNAASLKSFGVDSTTFLSSIIPNTFEIYFDANGKTILKKIFDDSKTFWTKDRKEKAEKLGFSTHQIITLASIVEEESTIADEKGNIASVYINRVRKKMKLQADPTVKFAMKNFAARQITYDMLKYPSPYNTYYAAGLMPGPICTPSTKTIDAVLDSPETPYLFFVANSDFSGKHIFTTNDKEHEMYANLWRKALAQQQQIKKDREAAKRADTLK